MKRILILAMTGWLASNSQAEELPHAHVSLINLTFPVQVIWLANDGKTEGEFETKQSKGVTAFDVPIGYTKLWAKPGFTNGFTLPVTYKKNDDRPTDAMVTPMAFTLVAEDHVAIDLSPRQSEPIAPWNGAIVRDKNGGGYLVSLSRPASREDIAKWEIDAPGNPPGKEEFATSSFFLAKYGGDEMARRVSQAFFEREGEVGVRVDHLSLISGTDGHSDIKDLSEAVAGGLETLMDKCSMKTKIVGGQFYAEIGVSNREFLTLAKEDLANNRGIKGSRRKK